MASRVDQDPPDLSGFLGEAIARIGERRWLPVALLFLLFLGGTNAALALLKPAPGEVPGTLFLAVGLVRLFAAVSIGVAALRIATDSPRARWSPDAGYWLYFLLGLPGIGLTAAIAWLGRELPVLDRILAMEFGAVAAMAPFGVWLAAIAVERPLAWLPRFRRIGAWLPALLLWSLLLVAPLACLHAWLSQRLLETVGTGDFWPLALVDAVTSTAFVLLGLSLRVTAYRVAQG
jgi:hypothetical protein